MRGSVRFQVRCEIPFHARSIFQASLIIPSWNQLLAWLKELDLLQRTEVA